MLCTYVCVKRVHNMNVIIWMNRHWALRSCFGGHKRIQQPCNRCCCWLPRSITACYHRGCAWGRARPYVCWRTRHSVLESRCGRFRRYFTLQTFINHQYFHFFALMQVRQKYLNDKPSKRTQQRIHELISHDENSYLFLYFLYIHTCIHTSYERL